VTLPGRVRHVSKTVRGSSREADAVLRDLIEKQVLTRPDGVRVTFGQLLDRWLEECDRLELSPTTMRTYRSQIEQTMPCCAGTVRWLTNGRERALPV
jgi:hypothetical protein